MKGSEMALPQCIERLEDLLSWAPGWVDGTLGEKILASNGSTVRSLLEALSTSPIAAADHAYPSIFPLEEGGLSLQWVGTLSLVELEVENGVMSLFHFKVMSDTGFGEVEPATEEQVIDCVERWLDQPQRNLSM